MDRGRSRWIWNAVVDIWDPGSEDRQRSSRSSCCPSSHSRPDRRSGRQARAQRARVRSNWQDSPREGIGRWLAIEVGKSVTELNCLSSAMVRVTRLTTTNRRRRLSPTATADSRCAGIGADRVVRFGLHGEMIAYAEIDVIARAMQPMPSPACGCTSRASIRRRFHLSGGADAADRGDGSRRGEGTPLAGVWSSRAESTGPQRSPACCGQTDSQGKYRLVGLPKSKLAGDSDRAMRSAVFPSAEQPYFMLNGSEIADAGAWSPRG